MMRLVRLGFVAAVLVCVAFRGDEKAAHAQSCPTNVAVSGDYTSGSAFGTMGTARGVAGQVIGCEVFSSTGGPPTMYCYAQVGGTSRYCFSSDPSLVTTVNSLTYNSYVYFSWSTGNCNYVVVQTLSCNP